MDYGDYKQGNYAVPQWYRLFRHRNCRKVGNYQCYDQLERFHLADLALAHESHHGNDDDVYDKDTDNYIDHGLVCDIGQKLFAHNRLLATNSIVIQSY